MEHPDHRPDRDREFTEFVGAQRTSLLRAARLLTAGDEAWAEDLVQTTLTRLYLAWPKVRRAGNPVGYARTSLTHAFVDETRRAHRRRERSTEAAPDRSAPEEDPDLRTVVLAALSELPPRQRATVVLRHWLDHDVHETARALGISEGTVKSQTAKAIAHLRAALAPTVITTVPEES